MNLIEFAKMSGVTIIRCDKEWGGTYGYKEQDYPNWSFCGYKTEKTTYVGWLEGKFGKTTAKALLKLLKPYPVQAKGKHLETAKAEQVE